MHTVVGNGNYTFFMQISFLFVSDMAKMVTVCRETILLN